VKFIYTSKGCMMTWISPYLSNIIFMFVHVYVWLLFSYDFASSIYLIVEKHNTNETSINVFSTSFTSDWLFDDQKKETRIRTIIDTKQNPLKTKDWTIRTLLQTQDELGFSGWVSSYFSTNETRCTDHGWKIK
jgi:hypothetical protein